MGRNRTSALVPVRLRWFGFSDPYGPRESDPRKPRSFKSARRLGLTSMRLKPISEQVIVIAGASNCIRVSAHCGTGRQGGHGPRDQEGRRLRTGRGAGGSSCSDLWPGGDVLKSRVHAQATRHVKFSSAQIQLTRRGLPASQLIDFPRNRTGFRTAEPAPRAPELPRSSRCRAHHPVRTSCRLEARDP